MSMSRIADLQYDDAATAAFVRIKITSSSNTFYASRAAYFFFFLRCEFDLHFDVSFSGKGSSLADGCWCGCRCVGDWLRVISSGLSA
jgi:hypothetical protein